METALKIKSEEPMDEITDTECLICKKPIPTDESAIEQGKYIKIQNRRVWICKDDVESFDRGRRIGQIELNTKVIQCLSTIEPNLTGWKLKEKVLELIPAPKRSQMIRNQINNFQVPSPRDVYSTMDKTVIGQDHAKKIVSLAVHEHYADINHPNQSGIPNPHHVLFIGPSGSGKTLIASTVASHLDVPYVSADSTIFSPTGFQGADVDSIIVDLVQKSRGVTALAERGVVFIDELDKLASYHHEGKSEAMNKSTQSSLLRMIEGKQIRIAQGPSEVATVTTSKMLFMFGGAFNGLSDIVAKKMGFKGRSISIIDKNKDNANVEEAIRTHEILSQATFDCLIESLEEYGIITELLGRIPSIVALAPLTEEELTKVALKTAHSPLVLQQNLFQSSGYNLVFTESFISEIVRRAHKMATGTRALRSLVKLAISEAAFNLLGNQSQDVDPIFMGTITIDADTLTDPKQYKLTLEGIESTQEKIAITI